MDKAYDAVLQSEVDASVIAKTSGKGFKANFFSIKNGNAKNIPIP